MALIDLPTKAAVKLLIALPSSVQARMVGPVPPEADDLAPEAWFLARLSRIIRDEPTTGAEMRAAFPASVALISGRFAAPITTRQITIPGNGVQPTVPARLYVPMRSTPPGPLLVYFHGGGWVVGSIDTHDLACRRLAHMSRVRILSVDYRLAPEDPFPASFDDALHAFRWAAANAADLGVDPSRIAVGGDSAGGNLAAAVAQHSRDDALAPAFQLLLYPVCDLTHDAERYPSYGRFSEGYVLTRASMDWYDEQYTPDPASRTDPRASPLLAAPAAFAGVAPAYVAVAVADPLCDEGVAYAQALSAAGVAADLQRVPHVHGFFNMGALSTGREHMTRIAGVLRAALVPATA